MVALLASRSDQPRQSLQEAAASCHKLATTILQLPRGRACIRSGRLSLVRAACRAPSARSASPAFRSLGLAYLVNELGNWLGEIALAILVFDQTGSPIATAALFCAMQFVPALLGPPLVARLEPPRPARRLPALYAAEARRLRGPRAAGRRLRPRRSCCCSRRSTASIASTARALTRATAAAAAHPGRPAARGQRAAQRRFTAGAAGGPALAGLVVAGAGVQTALLARRGLILAVAAAARPQPRPADRRARETEETDWRERLRKGLAYVRERPPLRRLLGRPGGRVRLLRARDPDRGRVRQGDARRRRHRLRRAARQLGRRHGRSAASLFAALRRVSLPALLLGLDPGDRRRLPRRPAARPDARSSPARRRWSAGSGTASSGSRWSPRSRSSPGPPTRRGCSRCSRSLASAMPGIGFVLGGAIAAIFEPGPATRSREPGSWSCSPSPPPLCGASTGSPSSIRATPTRLQLLLHEQGSRPHPPERALTPQLAVRASPSSLQIATSAVRECRPGNRGTQMAARSSPPGANRGSPRSASPGASPTANPVGTIQMGITGIENNFRPTPALRIAAAIAILAAVAAAGDGRSERSRSTS